MIKPYISKIHISDLHHLQDIEIPLRGADAPHLIVTGRNGSGKTLLLSAIADFLNIIKDDRQLSFLEYGSLAEFHRKRLESPERDAADRARSRSMIEHIEQKERELNGRVTLEIEDIAGLVEAYSRGEFVIAFYGAARRADMVQPRSPGKPVLDDSRIDSSLSPELLSFLSDLKIQEALARNEGDDAYADRVADWFRRFEKFLGDVMDDPQLRLRFNYRDYSFMIKSQGRTFPFSAISDGFLAVLDIVADLMLRMQGHSGLTADFSRPGIVLIDEVETHLHLRLQRLILPMLTSLFPNIQFIVTSHSPFVLCSLNNATAFDLGHRRPVASPAEYSWETIAQEYFGVQAVSGYARARLSRLEQLLQAPQLSAAERAEARDLLADFRRIPEAAAPGLAGAFLQLTIQYYDRIAGLEA